MWGAYPLLVLLALQEPATSQPAGQATTRSSPADFSAAPNGLCIVRPWPRPELYAFTQEPGCTVSLAVSCKRTMLDILMDQSALQLSGCSGAVLPLSDNSTDQRVAFDSGRHTAVVEVRSGNLPPTETTCLRLKGTLPVLTASTATPPQEYRLQLKKGEVLDAGAIKLRIDGVDMIGDETDVEFVAVQNMALLRSVRFRKLDKTVAESRVSSWAISRVDHQTEWFRSYLISTKDPVVLVEIETWSDMRIDEVPIDVRYTFSLE